ncbi:MAG: cobyrinate a,c-diamide synthase [Clostridiales bacterium]|nr:cobyrinate a,c-diamide synthase [Clostridiales bacterium]
MDRILIGGTHSGVGKTTVVAGILAALRRRGRLIVPFKVGPDYIDPGFHTLAAGTPAGNLDSWMLPPDQVLEVLARRAPAGSLAVIEGVMGLYDGRKNMGETGSTAHVAKITGSPVILVASGAKMARSAAALVGGYVHFDKDVPFAGVIFNHVSGESHYRLLRDAVQEYLGLPVFGYLSKSADITIPERHLGLLPAEEMDGINMLLARLAILVEEYIDLDGILQVATAAPALSEPGKTAFPPPRKKDCIIAVARDEAFHFYYPENLALLEAYGAQLIDFSPLHDQRLPENCAGIFLGGGFPEMFAETLAENEPMRNEIASAAATGMPVYAECGGYMYLSQELVDFEGRHFPMAGVFPGRTSMRHKRRALGYVEVSGTEGNNLLPAGETCRGHEFHWSDMEDGTAAPLYARVPEGDPVGERVGNAAGSYIHLHFLSNPAVACRFVDACREFSCGGK